MDVKTGFDYERTDIESTVIALLAVGLALLVIATPLFIPVLFPSTTRHQTPSAPPALAAASAPRLEIAPKVELARHRRGEAQLEQSYGWIDRDRGELRIPISRAMELLVQRGLPGWPSP